MLRPQDRISFPIDPDADLLDIPVPTSINEHGLTSYQMSYDDVLEYEVTREMVAGLIASLIMRRRSLLDQNKHELIPAIDSISETIARLVQIRHKISTTDPHGMTKVQNACLTLSEALFSKNLG